MTWAGLGQVANSFVMPGIPGYQPELNPYPYDVDAGRQHMAKALDALGVGSVAQLEKLRLRVRLRGATTSPLSRLWPRPGDKRSVSKSN